MNVANAKVEDNNASSLRKRVLQTTMCPHLSCRAAHLAADTVPDSGHSRQSTTGRDLPDAAGPRLNGPNVGNR